MPPSADKKAAAHHLLMMERQLRIMIIPLFSVTAGKFDAIGIA